jgi:hypothetical protein
MKRALLILLALASISTGAFAQTRLYKQGTVTRMRMADCTLPPSRLAMAFGAAMPAGAATETCTEYTLVSDRIVFIVVARGSGQLIPLAESIDFRMKRNVLLVKLDDELKESRFVVKEMTLRTEWERRQAEEDRLMRAAHSRLNEAEPGN